MEILIKKCYNFEYIRRKQFIMQYDYQKIVKTLRNKLILSQQDFAKLLGVSFASINRWETGRHEPTINAKRKIISLCQENDVKLIYKSEE